MRRIRLGLLLALLTIAGVAFVERPAARPQPDETRLAVLRYGELVERIKMLAGRVVVVDFWADYCAPCKREFPKLVDLQRKYARDGLTCVSVSLDDPADAEVRERVERFLAERKASGPNFLLAEKPDYWQAKLKIDGPPCVFLFNRRGELVQRFHDDVDYHKIEQLVIESLKD